MAARSHALAHLLAGLTAHEGKLSFADALNTCFEIAPYDPDIHATKLQNLVVRARQLLGRQGSMTTKSGWIFLTVRPGVVHVGASGLGRSRLPLPARARVLPRAVKAPRNERSLDLLLKEAVNLRDRRFTRLELERALQVPKATLNRYLKVWLARRWLKKTGSGRAVSYRLTFFDS